MHRFSKESFQRIYLLTGTAPDIYGTGHAARIPSIRDITSACLTEVHSVACEPDDYWKSADGQSVLQLLRNRFKIHGNPLSRDLVILDARDLDPSPLLPFASVLALDNRHPFRMTLESCRAGRPPPSRKTEELIHPCLFYDTLLHKGISLERSVRRYLGPIPPGVPQETLPDSHRDAGKGLHQDSGPASHREAGPGLPQASGSVSHRGPLRVVFYAGPPGFLSADLIRAMDEWNHHSDVEFFRIGGQDRRLPWWQLVELLHGSDLFIGYYGLTMYQAAACGCLVWGLKTGHGYHDDLLSLWHQGGGPVLEAIHGTLYLHMPPSGSYPSHVGMDAYRTPGPIHREKAATAPEALEPADGAKPTPEEGDLKPDSRMGPAGGSGALQLDYCLPWIRHGLGWSLPPHALKQGAHNLGVAIRGLERMLGLF